MPRPTQCPTPMASTELRAQDGRHKEGMEMLFELPPAALVQNSSTSTRSGSVESLSDGSEYTPPSSKTKPARKSLTKRARNAVEAARAKEQITLPPPPGRPRKIIEMKPSTSSASASKPKPKPPASGRTSCTPPPTKKSSTSRKISRKTAHSLIERRRRGKMNDEFEVLKDMVPACENSGRDGREMHKLEILKASVEYIRYLKDCVCKLQGGSATSTPCCPPQERRRGNANTSNEDEDTDVEMSIDDGEQEERTPQPQSQHTMKDPPIDPQLTNLPFNPPPTPKLSPAILPQPDRRFSLTSVTSPLTIPIPQPSSSINQREDQHTHTHSTASSTTSQDHRHFSFSPQQSHPHTSPERQLNTFSFPATSNGRGSTSTTSSAFTSPMLAAQAVADQDATVALLMLNGEWPSRGHMGSRDEPRTRGFKETLSGFANPDRADGQDRFGGRRRGLSVRDLLSS